MIASQLSLPLQAPNLGRQYNGSYRSCAEYFAGIGLFRLGLEQAGWNVRFSNDWDPHKFQMYSAYFGESAQDYLVKDVFAIDAGCVPETTLATASFPCVDLSLAGNMSGIYGQESSAFWGFINILQAQVHRPPLVILENVMGWLNSNGGADFRLTIQALNKLSYFCDVFVVDALHFVPQSRSRIFVVGTRTARYGSNLEVLESRSAHLKTATLLKRIRENQDLRWNFLDIPPLPKIEDIDLSVVVEELPDDHDAWWSVEEVKRHLAMMSDLNRDYVVNLSGNSALTYRTMYRRVRSGQQRAEVRKDGVAGCLRTMRGGSSRQMLIQLGKGEIEMRCLTAREYARLQGVPNNYPLPNNVSQALTGLGDAVCVPVIRWIAEMVLNPLADAIAVSP